MKVAFTQPRADAISQSPKKSTQIEMPSPMAQVQGMERLYSKMRRARRVYQLTEKGKQRFAELVADTGPQNFSDDGFGVHLAFFNRTPAEARMRILEGRRRQVEERREGLREAVARASSSIDRYTRQLHQLGLESSEREVKWLNELIAAERLSQGRSDNAVQP